MRFSAASFAAERLHFDLITLSRGVFSEEVDQVHRRGELAGNPGIVSLKNVLVRQIETDVAANHKFPVQLLEALVDLRQLRGEVILGRQREFLERLRNARAGASAVVEDFPAERQ